MIRALKVTEWATGNLEWMAVEGRRGKESGKTLLNEPFLSRNLKQEWELIR